MTIAFNGNHFVLFRATKNKNENDKKKAPQ